MQHRSGRALAVAAVATATAATAAIATSPASNAAPAAAPTAAGGTAARSLFGHQAVTLLRTPATAASPKTSTRMPLALGNYPLRIRTLTKDVLAPLQFVVTPKHQVLVADSAKSAIFRVDRTKLTKVLGGPLPGEIAGVDVNARGDLAYTWTRYSKTGPGPSGVSIVRKGHKRLD